MFEWIVSPENLFMAWREFRRGKRAKPDVQAFERHLEDEIFSLHGELVEGRYRHGPYHRFHVFDPKHRVIHKATVRDRLVHHAIHRVLTPMFDRSFVHDGYSCRIGKGTHAAVRRLEGFVRRVSRNYRQPCWALQFDIRKFFDSVDHDILLQLLARKVRDERTNGLLEEIVRSYRSSDCLEGGGGVRWFMSGSERCAWARCPHRESHLAALRERVPRRV